MKMLLIGTLFLLTFKVFAQAPIHSSKPTLVFTKTLTEYKGKLQIEVTNPVQIEFVQTYNRE